MEKSPQAYRDELAEKLREIRNDEAEGREVAHAHAEGYLDAVRGTPEYEQAREAHLAEAQKVRQNWEGKNLSVEGVDILKEVIDSEVMDRFSEAVTAMKEIGLPFWDLRGMGGSSVPINCDVEMINTRVADLSRNFREAEEALAKAIRELPRQKAKEFSNKHPALSLEFDPNWFSEDVFEPLERGVFGLTSFRWGEINMQENEKWQKFCSQFPATQEQKEAREGAREQLRLQLPEIQEEMKKKTGEIENIKIVIESVQANIKSLEEEVRKLQEKAGQIGKERDEISDKLKSLQHKIVNS